VRFATDRLTQLARTLPTAEHSKQDSQLEVLRTISPVIELPSLLRTAAPTPFAAVPSESFVYDTTYTIAGAGAAINADGPTLSPGLWHLQGHVRIQFSGTNNVANLSAYALRDVANNQFNFASAVSIAGVLVIPVDLYLSIADAGWFFRQAAPATVAGDVLALHAALLVARLT